MLANTVPNIRGFGFICESLDMANFNFNVVMGTALPNIVSANTREFPPFMLDMINQCLWQSVERQPVEHLKLATFLNVLQAVSGEIELGKLVDTLLRTA